MASSSSSTRNVNKYDVFVSFRGEDTRDSFTSHLYSALSQKSITFIDDQLNRGDEIFQSLLNAIQASSISVIIFSEGYASSRWCLDELVKILDCRHNHGQIVIPVFYRVDPSDVRNQRGIFGDSFSKLEERFEENSAKLHTWRNALKEAAGLSGFHSRNIRPESELVKKVVKHILNRLAEVFPPVSKNQLVGVESRVEAIESLLGAESKDVYTFGIWGIGGIGKTTIARAIFHKISKNFEGSCFLQNVREESERPGGLACLQQKLLSELLKDENVMANIDFNFTRLSRMKVLIILDDVTTFGQIESLIRSPDWFMPESRIIITTRDQQVLKNWGLKEKDIYEMKALKYDHALQLFSRHAFKQNCPEVDYMELSDRVIQYARGVPLALKILGAFLFGRRKEGWDSATKKLEMVPHMEIQKILKISYDGLDNHQQTIFLDIAFFFVGKNKDRVKSFLGDCVSFAEVDLSVLVDKSLITISEYNIISMHDLLRDMGREIVRQESPDDPGRRSRLWHDRDICKVLTKNMGTEAIKGISLDMCKINSDIQIYPYTFSKMTELRFLKFYGVENKCMLSSLEGVQLTEMRYFEWHQCPLKTLNIIHWENLVLLNMRDSKVKQLWDGGQDLVNLKEIDLSGSKWLTKLPNFKQAQNLEILKLRGCLSLMETHSSIQYLIKLEVLDLQDCKSLMSLPTGIHSKNLKELKLSGCSKLKNFPEILSSRIYRLDLREVGIKELPSSIECLSKLRTLCIEDCSRLENISSSIFKLQSLDLLAIYACSKLKRFLEIPSCNIDGSTRIERLSSSTLRLKNCSSLESLPSSLCMFKSLTYLDITDSEKLKRLPDELGNLEYLKVLTVEGVAIREVPESLGQLALLFKLELKNCSVLEYVSSSIFKLKSLEFIEISNCSNFKGFPEIPSCNIDETGIERLSSSELRLKNCSSLESLPSSLCMFKSLTNLDITDCEKLKRLPDELGNLEYLKVLTVEGAGIREVPESLGQLVLLYKLKLNNCSVLEYVSSSIFKLKSLQFIEISNCSNLKGFPEIPSCNIDETGIKRLSSSELRLKKCSSLESLPSSLCMFKSLTYLDITDCEKLKRLPDELGNLEYLKVLTVKGAAIRDVPESLGQLALLSKLELTKCSSFESLPSSLCMLKSLTSLQIIDCENFKRLPDEIGNLRALRYLRVEGTAIREVPESLGQLSSLYDLELSNNNLERIPESFDQLSSLEYFQLFESNLERIPEYLRSLPTSITSKLILLDLSVDLRNCLKLDPNELSEIVKDVWMKQLFHGERWIRRSMYFPGTEIPKWFRHQSIGSTVTLKTRPPRRTGYNKLMGFAFCTVLAFPAPECFCHQSAEGGWDRNLYDVKCYWKYKSKGYKVVYSWSFLGSIRYVESNYVFLGYYLFDGRIGYVNDISFSIERSYGQCPRSYDQCLECCEVKNCGIHFVYAQDSIESTEEEEEEEEEEPHPKRLKYSSTPSQLIIP